MVLGHGSAGGGQGSGRDGKGYSDGKQASHSADIPQKAYSVDATMPVTPELRLNGSPERRVRRFRPHPNMKPGQRQP
jgi:hypothetical protein